MGFTYEIMMMMMMIMDTIGVQGASRSSAWLKVGNYMIIIIHITENYSIEMFQHLVGGWQVYDQ